MHRPATANKEFVRIGDISNKTFKCVQSNCSAALLFSRRLALTATRDVNVFFVLRNLEIMPDVWTHASELNPGRRRLQ